MLVDRYVRDLSKRRIQLRLNEAEEGGVSSEEVQQLLERITGLPAFLTRLDVSAGEVDDNGYPVPHMALLKGGIALPAVRVHQIYFSKDEEESDFDVTELDQPREGDLLENLRDSIDVESMACVSVIVRDARNEMVLEETNSTLWPSICVSTVSKNFSSLFAFVSPDHERHKVYAHLQSLDLKGVHVSGCRVVVPFRSPRSDGFSSAIFQAFSTRGAAEFVALLESHAQRFASSGAPPAYACFVSPEPESTAVHFCTPQGNDLTKLDIEFTARHDYSPVFPDEVLAGKILRGDLPLGE